MKQSYKVWLVTESGYEHTTPLQAWSLRQDDEDHCLRLRGKHALAVYNSPNYVEPLVYKDKQIDLVAHDGAHVLQAALVQAVGKNA